MLVLAFGCDDEDDPGVDSGRPIGDGAVVGSLTEAEVAGAVNAINAAELAFARSVEDRLTGRGVQELAADVIAGHTANAAAHADLIADLGITPAESAVSTTIEQESAQLLEDLTPLSGAALDAAYIDAQIIMDAELLDDTQATLLPSTSTPEYRVLLFELRDVLVANLATGRSLDEPAAGPVSP
jgi:predicted outer membrane protein